MYLRALRGVAVWVAGVVLLLVAVSGYAQGNLGAISGTVTDSSGSVVAGASVTITNQATGVAVQVITDERGFYSRESIPTGQYRIDVKATGFQEKVTEGLQIDPGQRRANNVSLAVGTD
jgi:hypothetical protein